MKPPVLITGASRGIGRATALAFARAGYPVTITGCTHPDELFRLRDELLALPVPCLAVVADAGSEQDTERLFDAMQRKDLLPEIIINNAGIAHIGLLQDMSFAQWHRLIDTNLTSVFAICRLAIPHLLAKGRGHIINISSVWGISGASCEVAYSATKGAVNAMTRALARELGPSHIRVNAVACGIIDTSMNSHLSHEEKALIADSIPLGRLGTAAETADFLLQLATGADYLTGQVISFDGGWQ